MNPLDILFCRLQPAADLEEPLSQEDFPALYRAADSYSVEQQKVFYAVLGWELLLLLIAAVISMLDLNHFSWAILQAIVLFGALACAVYLFSRKPDRHWYSARAVAESVKTVSWRYVVRAEPFDVDDAAAREHFRQTLHAIVDQNRDVAQRFNKNLEEVQLTERMRSLRDSDFDTRKRAYLEGRITEQQSWYARKNQLNDCKSKRAFVALVLVLGLAGVFAICRVRYAATAIWPTDVLVTLATTVLAWTQAKRFTELAAAYSLAAFEISNLRLQAEDVACDDQLSTFVGDAENAFSREHTQWAARKDV